MHLHCQIKGGLPVKLLDKLWQQDTGPFTIVYIYNAMRHLNGRMLGLWLADALYYHNNMEEIKGEWGRDCHAYGIAACKKKCIGTFQVLLHSFLIYLIFSFLTIFKFLFI